nr:immunoglobulin light chain junction region [Macaca mulatta]MOX85310.1 immunoglobulin light chain junction region [Macaca mulatta]MOX88281.1 immunoglobulin light chain junction region [Macaca mulatta]MOX89447.1 immunoglobulin light chain junction region [Macaca mulatta]MOX90570.1 immunoglobulin light chain junction region [Macaca mulatta]
CQQYSSLPFTF